MHWKKHGKTKKHEQLRKVDLEFWRNINGLVWVLDNFDKWVGEIFELLTQKAIGILWK